MDAGKYEKMYKRLYKLFNNATPLKKDCGFVCGGACCKGDDKTGMLLFPHEKTCLKVYTDGEKRYAVCGGECDRAFRPLSCRIFPLFPVASDDGKISVAADTRGRGICPLVRCSDNVKFSPRFIRRVKKAGKLLYKDDECRALLLEISKEIDELSELAGLLDAE